MAILISLRLFYTNPFFLVKYMHVTVALLVYIHLNWYKLKNVTRFIAWYSARQACVPCNEIMLWFSGYYKIEDDEDKHAGESFGAVEATKPCVATISVRKLDMDWSFVLSFPEVLVFFIPFRRFSELSVVTCLMMMQRRAVSKLIMFGASKHTVHVLFSKRQSFPIGNRFWCLSSSWYPSTLLSSSLVRNQIKQYITVLVKKLTSVELAKQSTLLSCGRDVLILVEYRGNRTINRTLLILVTW